MGQNRFGMPQLPNMTGAPPMATGGAALDRQNIDALLRGEFDPYEINMQSAENAVGGGMAGSGFAQAGRYKLLDSEKLARQQMGNQMLDPYLNREHQQALQTQAESARMREIQADAQYAMERLQASEAGLGARLTQAEKAEMEQLILRGNQAMDLERLNQQGNIDSTLLGGAFSLLGRMGAGGGSSSTGSPTRPTISTHGFSGSGSANAWAGGLAGTGFMDPSSSGGYMMRGQDPARSTFMSGGSGGGDRNVNNLISGILRKYGFGNLKF